MIDKNRITAIHAELAAELKAFVAKHGLVFGNSNITYNNDTFNLLVSFGDAGSMNGTNPVFFNDMKKYGHLHGFSVDDIKKTVKFANGKEYAIMGMKGRNFIIGENGGEMWKLRPEAVKLALCVK